MAVFSDDHDYKKYPELSNGDLSTFGFVSPHPQIENDFDAFVVRVHDGDTVTLRVDWRDFDFPLRLASIDAPELNTGTPGEEARDFLKSLIENEIVQIKINRQNRVDKYGRLLGNVMLLGQDVGVLMMSFGYALPFNRRREGEMIDLNKTLSVKQWF